MAHIRIRRAAAALLILSFSTIASAQYIWLDENGSKQFSDMPPPSSVPKNRILKEPATRAKVEVGTEAASASASASASAASSAPMTDAEKRADAERRKQEQAKKDAQAAEAAKAEAEKAKNCDRARDSQRTLSSGQRISRVDKNGERMFLSDEQKAQELQEIKNILDKCK